MRRPGGPVPRRVDPVGALANVTDRGHGDRVDLPAGGWTSPAPSLTAWQTATTGMTSRITGYTMGRRVYRRLSRPETHLQCDDCRRMTSGVSEGHRSVTQPGDRRALLVQLGLT